MLVWRDLFGVFPMRMGVILGQRDQGTQWKCVPHAYGGDPLLIQSHGEVQECSPCVWG
ncbi:hypothetical protein HMPREF9104_00680 [Lentilactobacillus kisonensis F0435]|uniref:Uncharacterized protein n=1 Tax=Lentilactobacillus kisonensis F0435 TaxID=797516 RepID=H1LDK5_9LACO|nr:hypothetical protein HMPREF9104_00680 [Lentilactobacillus kisonensis F0435]